MTEVKDAIHSIAKVIEESRNEVLIMSGTLPHEVYQSQRICDAIQGALKRNVHFDIIVGPEYDCETKLILGALGNSIYMAPTCPEHHFAVGDRRHLRYELYNDGIGDLPGELNMSALNMPDMSQYLADRFYEFKPSCRPMKQRLIAEILIIFLGYLQVHLFEK